MHWEMHYHMKKLNNYANEESGNYIEIELSSVENPKWNTQPDWTKIGGCTSGTEKVSLKFKSTTIRIAIDDLITQKF